MTADSPPHEGMRVKNTNKRSVKKETFWNSPKGRKTSFRYAGEVVHMTTTSSHIPSAILRTLHHIGAPPWLLADTLIRFCRVPWLLRS
jgi:hypothetical protein